MSAAPVLPRYGTDTIAEILPAIGERLGVGHTEHNPLPEGERWVLLMVDGLGWYNLRDHADAAPFLTELATAQERAWTSGVPSTTVTSLTSLGTGLPPGEHGMVGYSSRMPRTGELFNALIWDSAVTPREYQPHPTCFETFRAAGIDTASVAPARFEGSGLTFAALRGPVFHGIHDERDQDQRVELTVAAAVNGPKTLTYVYERELDHTGHTVGCESPQWRNELIRIDGLVEHLREDLPDDVRLVITGDHGMLDIPQQNQIIIESHPDLMAGIDLIAGEGRLRQLYVDQEPLEAVARRWRDVLGERAWVRTRDEAFDEGWFGHVSPEVSLRYGHLLVAMADESALMTTTQMRELGLVGQHGSLTPVEVTIPLLVC
ncbi:alkaline phosphatase family protein [Enemella sp. A6]|uniref:alkaline phosphatase family protein n=1 Tax=Enemella sp. A6 TaxID=3440152 RepID=UPI003EB90EF2